MKNLGLHMMVKDEQDSILCSLKSAIDIVDIVIILYTGDIEETPKLIRDLCKKHDRPLVLEKAPFVDFAKSRNKGLILAETHAKFLLLLDAGDELQNADRLKLFLQIYHDCSGFKIHKYWYCGLNGNIDSYNTRLIQTSRGWHYIGRVHEYITSNHPDLIIENNRIKNSIYVSSRYGSKLMSLGELSEGYWVFPQEKLPEVIVFTESTRVNADINIPEVTIYQDRVKHGGSSFKRYSRDLKLLLEDHLDNPDNERTVFYLAQTYSCLGDHANAYKYYEMRANMGRWYEECGYAMYKCGIEGQKIRLPWEKVMNWFLQSWMKLHRIDPLLEIVHHYLYVEKDFHTADIFITKACEMNYPEEQVIFLDRSLYDYKRWHLCGIISYYVGKYERGKEACLKALKVRPNHKTDENNLKFYEEKLNH